MKHIKPVQYKADVSAFELVAHGTLALVRAMVDQMARNSAERRAIQNEMYGKLAALFASMMTDKD